MLLLYFLLTECRRTAKEGGRRKRKKSAGSVSSKNKRPKHEHPNHRAKSEVSESHEKLDASIRKISPSFDHCEALILSEFDRIFPCALSPAVAEHDRIFDEELSGLL